jgi:hypothetical protein
VIPVGRCQALERVKVEGRRRIQMDNALGCVDVLRQLDLLHHGRAGSLQPLRQPIERITTIRQQLPGGPSVAQVVRAFAKEPMRPPRTCARARMR